MTQFEKWSASFFEDSNTSSFNWYKNEKKHGKDHNSASVRSLAERYKQHIAGESFQGKKQNPVL